MDIANNITSFPMDVRLITMNVKYYRIYSINIMRNSIFLIVPLGFRNINRKLQGRLYLELLGMLLF